METKQSSQILPKPIKSVAILLLVGLVLWLWYAMAFAHWKDPEVIYVQKGELQVNLKSDIQTISGPGIWHVYEFSGLGGDRIEVDVKPLSNTFVDIRIYGDAERKNSMGEYPRYSDSEERGKEVIAPIYLPSTQIYYIEVNLGHDPGSYTIEITKY